MSGNLQIVINQLHYSCKFIAEITVKIIFSNALQYLCEFLYWIIIHLCIYSITNLDNSSPTSNRWSISMISKTVSISFYFSHDPVNGGSICIRLKNGIFYLIIFYCYELQLPLQNINSKYYLKKVCIQYYVVKTQHNLGVLKMNF